MELFIHKRHNPDSTGLNPLRVNAHTYIYSFYIIKLLYCITHKHWNYCYVTRIFIETIIINILIFKHDESICSNEEFLR